ncbi:hypothetical protein LCGC14_1855670 [marine sediment metagenome]|uniref:Capsid protein n=1 Tax=marine sediment metagenome TaxID=412755 RepID=A0A0F9G9G3_9ZZZZ
MALGIDEANAVSSKYFDKTMTDQVYEKSPFYVKLKSIGNVTTDGGNSIQWPIKYRKLDQTGFVGPRDQVSYTQKETRTAADLDWKYQVAQNMISLDERVKNSGKSQIVNLLSNKSTEIRDDVLDNFATALHAVTPGAKDISSLVEIVDTGRTYGGIAVTDAAEWAAGAEDNSTTELVFHGPASLTYMINQSTFGPDKPDLHLTTRDMWSKFESLLEPQKRYYNKDTALAKAGFTSLQWHDAEIISDVYTQGSGTTSAYWFGLDTNKFEIRYHPDYNFQTSKWFKLEQAGYPWAMAKTCIWAGNILCRMRKTSFKFTTLDYTK